MEKYNVNPQDYKDEINRLRIAITECKDLEAKANLKKQLNDIYSEFSSLKRIFKNK